MEYVNIKAEEFGNFLYKILQFSHSIYRFLTKFDVRTQKMRDDQHCIAVSSRNLV